MNPIASTSTTRPPDPPTSTTLLSPSRSGASSKPYDPSDPLLLTHFVPLLRRTLSGERERDCSPVPFLEENNQEKFLEALKQKNVQDFTNFQSLVRTKLDEAGIDLEAMGTVLLTTGSDGRDEKTGRFSPYEMIIVTKSETLSTPLVQSFAAYPSSPLTQSFAPITTTIEPQEISQPCTKNPLSLKETIEKIKAIAQQLQPLVAPFVEVKDLEKHHGPLGILTMKEGASKVIPSRALQAKPIAGSLEIFHAYKRSLVAEIQHHEWKLKDFKTDFVASERRILRNQLTGKLESGINLEIGELLFIPNPATPQEFKQKGCKYGPTRFLQYSITLCIARHLEGMQPEAAEQFLAELPNSMIEQIQFLQRKGILKFTELDIQQFKSVYANLLFWYAMLQDRASRTPLGPVRAVLPKSKLHTTLEQALALGEKICPS